MRGINVVIDFERRFENVIFNGSYDSTYYAYFDHLDDFLSGIRKAIDNAVRQSSLNNVRVTINALSQSYHLVGIKRYTFRESAGKVIIEHRPHVSSGFIIDEEVSYDSRAKMMKDLRECIKTQLHNASQDLIKAD